MNSFLLSNRTVYVYLTADIALAEDWMERVKAPTAPSNYKDPEKIAAYETAKRASLSTEIMESVGELWDLRNVRAYALSPCSNYCVFGLADTLHDAVVFVGEHAEGIMNCMLSKGFKHFRETYTTKSTLPASNLSSEDPYVEWYHNMLCAVRFKDPCIQFRSLESLLLSSSARQYMLPTVCEREMSADQIYDTLVQFGYITAEGGHPQQIKI